jgi:hypothetical protein
MLEYYIIFSSLSLNDIYWIYVFVYIYSPFQKQADLLLYITGRCLCWPCLHYYQSIISFDVMMLLLLFRAIWNFEVRHKYILSCKSESLSHNESRRFSALKSDSPTISLKIPVPSQDHYGFHSFPVVD